MDVLQLLDNELKDKSNWSLEYKARYLFIRSCEMFSYDARYSLFLKIYPREKVRKIVLREIDLRNVTDFRVLCTNYSRYVFKRLVEELLNIHVDVCGTGHEYNEFEINTRRYRADATNTCDLEHVKMGLRTKDYYDIFTLKRISDKKIELVDRNINYLKEEYFDDKLKKIVREFEEEYQNKDIKEVDYLLAKLDRVKELFDEINVFHEYSDAIYCLSRLLDEFFKESFYYFEENKLYEMTSDGDWNFGNLLDITFKKEKFNFVLEKVNGEYEFRKISLSEGEHYKKELTS